MAKNDVVEKQDRKPTVLAYQLDFLKLEFEAINQAIRRIDETTQGTKNWAVVVWAGALGIAFSTAALRNHIVMTAIIPLMFWFVDAYWRHIQRSFIFRNELISEFLNGDKLTESIKNGKVTGFWLLDPRAQKERYSDTYHNFTGFRHTIWFQEVAPFYGGLIAMSGVVAWFVIA